MAPSNQITKGRSMDTLSLYLIGQMSSEVIRSGIVVGAGKSDIAMAEK